MRGPKSARARGDHHNRLLVRRPHTRSDHHREIHLSPERQPAGRAGARCLHKCSSTKRPGAQDHAPSSSENTFALEELAEELKDAKTRPPARDTRPYQGAARSPNKICGGRGAATGCVRRRRAGERSERPHEFQSADARRSRRTLAEAALLGRAKRQETKSRLVAYVRAATAREVDVLAAQNTPKASPSKERKPQAATPPRPRPLALWSAAVAGRRAGAPRPRSGGGGRRALRCRRPRPRGLRRSVGARLRRARRAPPARRPSASTAARLDERHEPPPLGAGDDVPDRVASIWEKAFRTSSPTRWRLLPQDRAAAEAPAPAPPRRKADPPFGRAPARCKKGRAHGAAPRRRRQ